MSRRLRVVPLVVSFPSQPGSGLLSPAGIPALQTQGAYPAEETNDAKDGRARLYPEEDHRLMRQGQEDRSA